MMKTNELLRNLSEMIKAPKAGGLQWDIKCSTTEYNAPEDKPVVVEEGISWTVDECYVSFHCEYKGKEFLLITYEMIHSAGDKSRTTNLVFLPPLGIRYFDINVLMDYAIETDQMLVYEIHQLWLTLIEEYQTNQGRIRLDVDERKLTID